jgi:hypothetical protein
VLESQTRGRRRSLARRCTKAAVVAAGMRSQYASRTVHTPATAAIRTAGTSSLSAALRAVNCLVSRSSVASCMVPHVAEHLHLQVGAREHCAASRPSMARAQGGAQAECHTNVDRLRKVQCLGSVGVVQREGIDQQLQCVAPHCRVCRHQRPAQKQHAPSVRVLLIPFHLDCGRYAGFDTYM